MQTFELIVVLSGDIGEMSPDGVLKIIDRKKNIFKLSQGEYVASEYLEKVYGFTPIVEDVSLFSLVCIIIGRAFLKIILYKCGALFRFGSTATASDQCW